MDSVRTGIQQLRPETEWCTATQRADAPGLVLVLPVFEATGRTQKKEASHTGTPHIRLVRRDRQNEHAGRLSRPGRALASCNVWNPERSLHSPRPYVVEAISYRCQLVSSHFGFLQ